ncbi:hypothetical protein [Actinomadura rugatobispora]|uniref:Uncharacterized protein n=1 Tax=Actinomadura rugatobispora TaxID=1994 RepID=A0ABW1A7C5_9ACTN|nr:hypothetical protein GCM10010200_018910 [Actinomadura rugatobispora]
MCVHEPEAKEALVADYIQAHPDHPAAVKHPALDGVAEISWATFPGCPAGVPALFAGLLDRSTGAEALRVLEIVLTDGLFHVSAAMPTALPFLIRLATDSSVPVRADMAEWVLLIAVLSRPVDENSTPFDVTLNGLDLDHPERAECRAVFAEHAAECRTLIDETTEDLFTSERFDALLAAPAQSPGERSA